MYYSGTITGNGAKLRRECIQKLVPYFEANDVTAEQVKAFDNDARNAVLTTVGLPLGTFHSKIWEVVVTILDPNAMGSNGLRRSYLGQVS